MADEKRLIDANAKCVINANRQTGHIMCVKNGIIEVIDKWGETVCSFTAKDIPAVDAVEVVRCKACEQHTETKAENVVYCRKFNRFMKVDDFCSYGERREGA